MDSQQTSDFDQVEYWSGKAKKLLEEKNAITEEHNTLLRSQRLYGTGPEQLKKAIDANYKKSNRIAELERHLERVLSWQETTETIAPELGGLIKEMNVAKGVLANG